MSKWIALTAGSLGLLAVLLGAFAAHSLTFDASQKAWFETANRYHFYHALGLLLLSVLPLGENAKHWVGALWVTGLTLFSGSLYLAGAAMAQWFWLTPIGGVLLLLGWSVLIVAVVRSRVASSDI